MTKIAADGNRSARSSCSSTAPRAATAFDNIGIDRAGRITLNEDFGNARHVAKIWQYDAIPAH